MIKTYRQNIRLSH